MAALGLDLESWAEVEDRLCPLRGKAAKVAPSSLSFDAGRVCQLSRTKSYEFEVEV